MDTFVIHTGTTMLLGRLVSNQFLCGTSDWKSLFFYLCERKKICDNPSLCASLLVSKPLSQCPKKSVVTWTTPIAETWSINSCNLQPFCPSMTRQVSSSLPRNCTPWTFVFSVPEALPSLSATLVFLLGKETHRDGIENYIYLFISQRRVWYHQGSWDARRSRQDLASRRPRR